jgi:hypothetical protein
MALPACLGAAARPLRGPDVQQLLPEMPLSQMSWTHAICVFCWEVRCITEGEPGRRPAVLVHPKRERCCFCGQGTQEGIYVRHDPGELTCRHEGERHG